ncbi:hypothetical protein GCM10011571_20550 [Marinithermofilum abyssi]|uniref:Uncharacterized protein n=1 Tax=Marinithermofilum abyssi TaxID=1571185 RepID=A0A8J2YAR5_9BACL|nr:hypothetical protein GCM10011571_20550 [Marinithermofilum abyssi]
MRKLVKSYIKHIKYQEYNRSIVREWAVIEPFLPKPKFGPNELKSGFGVIQYFFSNLFNRVRIF